MSRTLVTHPGRAGDIAWALPTARAISEGLGEPVDFLTTGEFESLLPLLQAGAPYLDHVAAEDTWSLTPPEEWRPPLSPARKARYDRILHLGYRGWPSQPLPHCVYQQQVALGVPMAPLDLARPWLTLPPWEDLPHLVVMGWSDCYFELKVGLITLLQQAGWSPEFNAFILPAPGSRWVLEADYVPVDWLEAGRRIAAADLFLGDCSALHVLACALGRPTIIVEPMEARWNPIFYPYGMEGPQVRVVMGNDQRPTWDSRHVRDTLQQAIQALQDQKEIH